MRVILFCCCENAVVDMLSQRLSVFNYVEALSTPAFPYLIPSMTIVVWLERETDDPETGELTARWLLNQSKIADMPIMIKFQERPKTRTIARISGLTLEGPGVLDVQLRFGRKKLATWRISVEQTGKPRAVEVGQETVTKTSTSKSNSKD